MRIFFIIINCLIVLNTQAQQTTTLDWINQNAITIEDSNPDSKLINFTNKTPEKFSKAQFFGFGEATHHGKDFFDIKAKFFKHLVEKQNVRIFIMEESYQAELGINEWISGGKGDRKTIADNFSIAPWYCKEVVDLLEWMRNYNLKKPKEEQIRFYGIDTQIGKNINIQLRNFVTKHGIIIEESLLKAADSCSEKQTDYSKKNTWADSQIPKLEEIERVIQNHPIYLSNSNNIEFLSILRALNYLKNFTTFIQNPKTDIRDEQMFKNLVWLMEHIEKDKKVFIWAHNEHINKKGHSNSIINLGNLLKKNYDDKYYAVGFDFGIGVLPGLKLKNGKPSGWEYQKLEKPYKNTFAETLINAESDIYFVDMEFASENEKSNFFKIDKKHLTSGGAGFNIKKTIFIKRNYIDSYDGLIFVKSITYPSYKI
ncbi:erythromycin esterase family protein [Flavobacterium facile]|uniref:erythromycin esterase family protein n=1 Tax=Flavobacterium facile TaxID=2893174 RepID=UPI002E7869E0|nr:erythromycin esterase family protein [Flavobacterium sp. T-12]